MSNSSLAKDYIPSPPTNHWGKRVEKIAKIIIHHAAAVTTAERIASLFASEQRKASATYAIGNDGKIIRCLDENIAPGTSGGYEADKDAVTIEVANSEVGGVWPVSDEALNSLIKLCADIAERNSLGDLVKGRNLCWHSMFDATACPGEYLKSKMGFIASEANKINRVLSGGLSGVDIGRGADALILYFKGNGKGSTGTNQWGYEVRIDKNGVVLEDPHYSGNTLIPKEGKVLSGHGKAGAWIRDNIRQGYLVWFENGKTCVSTRQHRSVDSINNGRGANYLSVFNAGAYAPTNKYGTEVSISASGKAGKPIYGVGKMIIPKGGYVLSGHGTASSWILENIKQGANIDFNGRVITVK